jgi:hypothetical protein
LVLWLGIGFATMVIVGMFEQYIGVISQ